MLKIKLSIYLLVMLTLTTRKTSDCRKKKKERKKRERKKQKSTRGSDCSTRPFSTPMLTGLGMRLSSGKPCAGEAKIWLFEPHSACSLI